MKLLKFFERILPLIFWVLLIFAFDTPCFAVLTMISALIHELGHIFAGFLCGRTNLLPKATKFGFLIKAKGGFSYKSDLILTLGGPLINLFIGSLLLLFFWKNSSHEYILLFALVNILTAVSNLLPVRGYDGFGILSAILYIKMRDCKRAEAVVSAISRISTLVLLFLSLFLLLKIGEGYWLFIILFCSFISDLKKLHI